MKQRAFAQKILAPLLVLLALCGCRSADTGHTLREYYQSLNAATMDVVVCADFGDRSVTYTLRYANTPEGESVTVLAPQEIAGIKVNLTPDGSRLQYDGLVLETGALPGTGLSPLEAAPFALRAWRDGYVLSQTSDSYQGADAVCVTHTVTRESQTLKLITWFDQETLKPLASETYADDTRVLTCTYQQVDFS